MKRNDTQAARKIDTVVTTEIKIVTIEELMQYHAKTDGVIPSEITKVPNCFMIKFAARHARKNKLLGVRYSHEGARHSNNGYEADVVLLDGAQIQIDRKDVMVSEVIIKIGKFVVITALARKKIKATKLEKIAA